VKKKPYIHDLDKNPLPSRHVVIDTGEGVPPETSRNILLQVLLWLGLAAGGGLVGWWSGKTWVFTPTLEPPEITQVVTKSLRWAGERVPLARVEVSTAGIGRVALHYTYLDAEGKTHQGLLPAQARADRYVFDLRRDLRIGWSTLELPSWITKMEVWSFRGDWDGQDPNAPHKILEVK